MEDPSVYVQNACITDPSLAPDGCSTVYVLVPVPNTNDSIVWDDIKAEYRDLIIKQMEKLGYEGLQGHIISETIVTPDDWGNSDIYRGAVFNLAHGLDQMLWRRPQNRFEEFNNVYLVGGGTHPGSGLPTIFGVHESVARCCSQTLASRHWNGVDTWFPDQQHPLEKRKATRIRSGNEGISSPQ